MGLIDWQSLHVVRSSGLPVHGSAKSRALQAWRAGTGDYRVTHGDWQPASPDNVDWTGFTVPPPRRGGPSGVVPEAKRATVLLPRVSRGVATALAGLAARTGEQQAAIVTRLVLAEVERVGS